MIATIDWLNLFQPYLVLAVIAILLAVFFWALR